MTSIRVPAEWEPQSAIWLAWPISRDTWPGMQSVAQGSNRFVQQARFDRIPRFFESWVRLIAEDTPVRILGRPDDHLSRRLNSANILWVDISTNDCWIRDYGPTFVLHEDDRQVQSVRAIDWRYNAWGGKYEPWQEDNAAAKRIAEYLKMPVSSERMCLEGGALETDGRGRLLTTTDCLITPTRNPDLSKAQIEMRLRDRLGMNEIVWLEAGLAGDDTDGHIDQLARFIDAENIVVASCDDPNDVNFESLSGLRDQLQHWSETTRPSPRIHALPVPPPRSIDGQRVPESYCNFLWLGANRLLVPTFGHPKSDDRALGILRELVAQTGRRTDVIGVDCRDMIWGLGALHCASRDQPALG